MSILASITSITTIPPSHEFQGWFSRRRARSILRPVHMHFTNFRTLIFLRVKYYTLGVILSVHYH